MSTIKLVDGTEFKVSSCIGAKNVLWIRFADRTVTLGEIAKAFDNKENVSKIVETTELTHRIYQGYTKLFTYTVNDFGPMIGLSK